MQGNFYSQLLGSSLCYIEKWPIEYFIIFVNKKRSCSISSILGDELALITASRLLMRDTAIPQSLVHLRTGIPVHGQIVWGCCLHPTFALLEELRVLLDYPFFWIFVESSLYEYMYLKSSHNGVKEVFFLFLAMFWIYLKSSVVSFILIL